MAELPECVMSENARIDPPHPEKPANFVAAGMTSIGGRLFTGGGEMGKRIRELDWSKTELGPVASWPQALLTSLSICLNSRFPMFVWWGPRFNILYNDAYIPMLGAKHPEALGKPGREAWGDIWEVIGPMLARVMETGEATWSENQLLVMQRLGYTEETYFTFSYSPIYDQEGKRPGIFCAVSETTAQVLGERRLDTLREVGARASAAVSTGEACESFLQGLTRNPADIPFAVIYLPDREGNRLLCKGRIGLSEVSPAAPEVIGPGATGVETGWPVDDVLTTLKPTVVEDLERRFGDLPGGAWPDPPKAALILPIALPGGPSTGVLVVGLNSRRALDNDYRSFLELVAGHLATALANASTYEEEKRRAEALAEIDRAKTAFFSNVSHEFRTPLTLILGPMEELLSARESSLAAQDREQIEIMHRNSLRLLKLVNTLLDFSRIEAGRVEACYAATDLAACTAELASVFRSTMERAGLLFSVDCQPLPEPIFVDRDMWEKIVFNLLSNAFKFTLAGEIRVTLRAEGNGATLCVSDTGVGIPQAELPNVFKRFYRIENAGGRTHEGTGIGLALTRELVRLHGGEISVESEAGRGSSFRVHIPAGKQHLPPERIGVGRSSASTALPGEAYLDEASTWLSAPINSEEENETVAAPDVVPDTKRARILLVEDNSDMREYLRRLLGGPYEVEVAANGVAALEVVKVHQPDLVLSDVMMPEMNGFELLRHLRSDPHLQAIPIILISARAGEEAEVEGISHGADDYLTKPFSARELLTRVATHLELARIRREATARVEEILESTSDAFVALDKEWRFTYLNRNYLKLVSPLHSSVRDLLGQSLWEKFPDIVGTEVERAYRGSMVEQKPGSLDIFYEPLQTWLEVRTYPSPETLSIYIRDVTERKRAEMQRDALLESEKAARVEAQALYEKEQKTASHLALALSAADLGDWSWDASTDMMDLSQRAAEIYDLPAGYRKTRTEMRNLLHEDDQERARRAAELAARTHSDYDIEYRINLSNGALRWVAAKGRVVLDEDGQLRGMLGVVQDITERKRQEAELKELSLRILDQARLFDATLSNIADLAYAFDRDKRVIYANRALLDLWGVSLDQAAGKSCTDLGYPSELVEELESQMQKVFETKKSVSGVTLYLGEYHEYIYSPALAPDGTVTAMVGTTRIITERKRAEAVDGRYRQVLQHIAEAAPLETILDELIRAVELQTSGEMLASVLLLDEDGAHLRHGAAPSLPAAYNAAIDGVAIGPDVGSCGTAAWLKKPVVVSDIATDPLWRNFKELARAHGLRACWSTPILSSEGSVLGIFAMYYREPRRPNRDDLNIVETAIRTAAVAIHRQRAEKALRESEARFRNMADSAPVMIWVTEPNGSCTFLSKSWYDFTGQTPETGLGYGWLGATHPDDRASATEAFLNANAKRVEYRIECRFRRKDGEYRWGINASTPRFTSDGQFLGFIGSVLDITEQKQVEGELREAKEIAEAAGLAKDKFLAVLSHELRTPLNPVLMTTAALEADPDLPPAIRADMAMIRRNVELETKLIDDLLDLSRITSGKLTPRFEPVALDDAVRQVCGICRPQILEKKIRLTTELRAASCRITADPARLQQVLWNVLKNAVKFTPESGSITVSTRVTDTGRVQVRVCDSGIGIEPGNATRIFDAFEQGNSAITRQFGGLGLGLAISKALVEMHHGSIWAESEGLGKGSAFTIDLPLGSSTVHLPSTDPVHETKHELANLKLLLVEDHPDTARTLGRLLRLSGYAVETAGSISAALDIAARETFDLLVSDLGLPDGTGYELMQQIRERYSMKGIAMSGFGMEEDLRKSREAGFSEHLVKPLSIPQLQQAIYRVRQSS